MLANVQKTLIYLLTKVATLAHSLYNFKPCHTSRNVVTLASYFHRSQKITVLLACVPVIKDWRENLLRQFLWVNSQGTQASFVVIIIISCLPTWLLLSSGWWIFVIFFWIKVMAQLFTDWKWKITLVIFSLSTLKNLLLRLYTIPLNLPKRRNQELQVLDDKSRQKRSSYLDDTCHSLAISLLVLLLDFNFGAKARKRITIQSPNLIFTIG